MSFNSVLKKIVDGFITTGEKVEGDIAKVQTVLQKDEPAIAAITAPVFALVQSVGDQAIGIGIDGEITFGVTPPAGTTPWPPLPSTTSSTTGQIESASEIIASGKQTATGLQLFASFSQKLASLPPGAEFDAEAAYVACQQIAAGYKGLLASVSITAPAAPAKP